MNEYENDVRAAARPTPEETSGISSCGGLHRLPSLGDVESGEDDLTRAALEDPAGVWIHSASDAPTLWRVVTLAGFAILALGIVFWWR